MRPQLLCGLLCLLLFQSTHPLRGATNIPNLIHYEDQFQSTHPLRGATRAADGVDQIFRISIHAPLAGCDLPTKEGVNYECNFNPRTPCGVRPEVPDDTILRNDFNPRTPCGVRRGINFLRFFSRISIHAPLAGCDCSGLSSPQKARKFQSTHPLRGAT